MSVEVLDELARARAAFDAWRAGRAGGGRIPDHLWTLAESLLDHHSPQTVARELGLNPGRLRARLERRSAPSPKARSSKPTFVELRTASPEPAAASPTRSELVEPADLVRLTLERRDGSSLTLAVPASVPALAERLIACFTAAVV
jgi:hypothetical protein